MSMVFKNCLSTTLYSELQKWKIIRNMGNCNENLIYFILYLFYFS
jgi:hypothetical protein